MLRFGWVAAAVLALLAANAASAQQVSNPAEVFNGFNQSEMEAVGFELGFQVNTVNVGNGKVALEYVTPEGYSFYVTPNACSAEANTCFGLLMFAAISDSANVPVEALNYFNQERPFTQAVSQDGTIFLRRYIISDFGVQKGNVAVNYMVFLRIAVDFVGYLQQGLGGVSFSVPTFDDGLTYHGLAESRVARPPSEEAGYSNPFNSREFAGLENIRMFKSN